MRAGNSGPAFRCVERSIENRLSTTLLFVSRAGAKHGFYRQHVLLCLCVGRETGNSLITSQSDKTKGSSIDLRKRGGVAAFTRHPQIIF